MRAASTGGGHVRLVDTWLVAVLAAVLVMTAAGASPTTSAAAASDAVAATATAAVAAAAAAAAAARKTAAAAAAAADDAVPRTASGPPAAENAMACEPVRVSAGRPTACTGQITEGPGPPPPPASRPPSSSRCPAAPATCADRSDNNFNDNNNNNNNSNHQCLVYARRELIPTMCPDDPDAYLRPGRLHRYRLPHCCHHTVESVVQRPYVDRDTCTERVESALHMDGVAAAMSCQFDEVLARYDCEQKYSARSCESCKDAYARWACAAILPHWTRTADDGRRPTADDKDDDDDDAAAAAATAADARVRRYRVKACRSVCLAAEQMCPWLLPVADDTNPYAGEAAFTCMDPDIGYQVSPTDRSEHCCYEHCAGGDLCVRNASMCGDSDQRPVCVEDVKLADDGPEEKCDDYSLTDVSAAGGGRIAAPPPPLLVLSAAVVVHVVYRRRPVRPYLLLHAAVT